jgi:outer membrane protein OmpA-like peptidoglycan-associated protein
MALAVLLTWAAPALAASANLITRENGAKVVASSSSWGGGWDVENLVPSTARLAEPGVTAEDFVWCSADGAAFPHFAVIDLGKPRWITTFVFNNALKEEPAYPGISARNIEVWAGAAQDRLQRVASFELERNLNGQSVKIEPLRAQFIKFAITSNWGHETWTELNATEALDDGTRPAAFEAALDKGGEVRLDGLYFDFASDRLRAESDGTLQRLAAFMKAHPGRVLVVEGHTDDRGSAAFNADLSVRRANAVVKDLVRRGIDPVLMQAAGHGADAPVASNDSAEGRALNRRVVAHLASN